MMYLEKYVMSEAEIQGRHKEFNIQEIRQLYQLIHFFQN